MDRPVFLLLNFPTHDYAWDAYNHLLRWMHEDTTSHIKVNWIKTKWYHEVSRKSREVVIDRLTTEQRSKGQKQDSNDKKDTTVNQQTNKSKDGGHVHVKIEHAMQSLSLKLHMPTVPSTSNQPLHHHQHHHHHRDENIETKIGNTNDNDNNNNNDLKEGAVSLGVDED